MISKKFMEIIKSGDITRAKILLKDSLLLDPTFDDFDEMLSKAKLYLPNLIQEHDGKIFEEDANKWDIRLMNLELMKLLENFSNERIIFVKKLITKQAHDSNQKDKSNTFSTNKPCTDKYSSDRFNSVEFEKIFRDSIELFNILLYIRFMGKITSRDKAMLKQLIKRLGCNFSKL